MITFESDKNIIVYAFEKVLSYARDNQYIFLAQSIWWISSIIGLQQGLVIHINNLHTRVSTTSLIHPDRRDQISVAQEVSNTPRDLEKDQRSEEILKRAKQFIEE